MPQGTPELTQSQVDSRKVRIHYVPLVLGIQKFDECVLCDGSLNVKGNRWTSEKSM